MMVSWLRQQGFKVLSATSGEAAIKQASAHLPDLILLDVMMPDITGIEVCKRLRGQEATDRIPVILITAFDPSVGRVEALIAGATDYITKPINFADLRVRLQTLLAHQEGFVDQGQRLLDEMTHATLTIVPCSLVALFALDFPPPAAGGQIGGHQQGEKRRCRICCDGGGRRR